MRVLPPPPLVLLFCLCLVLVAPSLAQQALGPAPKVPEWINLTPPPPEVEQQAAEKLLRLLDKAYTGSESLVKGDLLVIDPPLWEALRARPELTGADMVKVSAILPRVQGTLTGEGSAFREAPAVKQALGLLRQRLAEDGPLTVRRVTGTELDYVWALIPFDIDGPLLTVESPRRRMIFLTDAEERMMQVFELPKEDLDLDAALDLIAALPLTKLEEHPLASKLDDPDLSLPETLPSVDIALLPLLEKSMFAARVDDQSLAEYVGQVDKLLTSAVPSGSGRVLVQASFGSDGKTTIHIRAPQQASPTLKSDLAAIAPLPVKGPVTILMVKDR